MSFGLDFAAYKTLVLILLQPPAPFLLVGAWGGWRLARKRRGGGGLLAFAALGIWLGCTAAAGEWLTRSLLAPPPPLSIGQIREMRQQGPEHSAVVVLGGGARQRAPEFHGPGLHQITAERLHFAVWLARRSGWPMAFAGGIGWMAADLHTSEAAVVMRVSAEIYGAPVRWAEGKSRDTRENAAQILPILASSGVQRIVLVTHDSHMRRALRAFREVAGPLGIEVTPAPVGWTDIEYNSLMDWCPTSEGYARVRYAVYEWLAWQTGR